MERYNNLDVFKFILAIMVFLIHYSTYLNVQGVLYQVTVNGIYRIAVPIFFVINGFFFFGGYTKGRAFNYIKRIFILYTVWMFVYSPFWVDYDHFTMKAVLKNLIFGFHHLWYLPALIFSALLFVAMRDFSDKAKLMVSVILYLTGTCIGYLTLSEVYLFELFSGKPFLYRNGLFFSFFFFVSGFLIKKYDIASKVKFRNIIAISIFGIVLLIIESILFRFDGKDIDMLFSLMLFCPAIFIAVLASKQISIKINPGIPNAIYFSHPLAKVVYESGFVYFSHVFLYGVISTFFIVCTLIYMPERIKKVLI
ncbi:Serine/alanine racemase [Serratia fonticola]|uniref:acyltransferase family protein n=1 Tax=Serratia fonticola TaxID=47917 RepID=UPI0021831503|nr:acyltransferase family protein [Serratia fonticola]CAI2136821.1 Serine/alanine racemase [Serratia fonticola]